MYIAIYRTGNPADKTTRYYCSYDGESQSGNAEGELKFVKDYSQLSSHYRSIMQKIVRSFMGQQKELLKITDTVAGKSRYCPIR